MTLTSPVTDVKGVGQEIGKKLKAAHIETVGDLIDFLPRRYDDFSNLQTISEIKPGIVTIKAKIKQSKGRYSHRGLHITEAAASDNSGSVRLVWFNQPYRAESLKSGQDYYVSGLFELRAQRLSIMNPKVELVSDFPINTARIVPIYSEAKDIKSHEIRRFIRQASALIDRLPEILPDWIVKEQKLVSRKEAIFNMHFPASADKLAEAKRRLGFEEVFELSLASLFNKYELLKEHSIKIPFKEKLAKDFVSHLPFQLTDDQRKVVWQIYLDMQKNHPMNRLVEGDVGSGKTVVGTMAALMAMEQGFQVAFMAPTELLARQHAETIYRLLEPMGYGEQVGLLVGSLKPTQKREVQTRIKNGDVRLMIGTHALIAEKVDMHKLGLIIIDEQHRFGVQQRKKLQAKAGHMPHVLSLTATPIPRSLALTLYGELDISIIGQKPSNRKSIITKIVLPSSKPAVYTKIKKELADGRQMFVVCPLISESDKMPAKAAETVFGEVKKDFKGFKVGLLHGRLKPDAKTKVMQEFLNHQLDVVVSTTVIEVGVDVPNATVMLIEDVERFGLAQIHQLRGRVGRSRAQGHCFLMINGNRPPSRRLKAIEASSDGFELAELDLELRGPGAIYGTMQHGLLDLRVAKLSDTKLIAAARNTAQKFIDSGQNLLKYKELANKIQNLRKVTNLN